MEGLEKSKHVGRFTIESQKEIQGELALAGSRSSLRVWDEDESCSPELGQIQFLKGVLHNLTKVSLINCLHTSYKVSHPFLSERVSTYTFFPHYVIFGKEHLFPQDEVIVKADFVIDDATTLFCDSNAFGFVIHPHDTSSLIEQIVGYNTGREIEIGPSPEIAYFTGKTKIFSADTALGKVSASHAPSVGPASSRGIEIKNTISVNMQFANAVTFETAVYRIHKIRNFLGLLVGRSQNLMELTVSKEVSDEKSPVELQVYGSLFPRYERLEDTQKSRLGDMLVDAIQHPEKFSCILTNWLSRHEQWHDARGRFFGNFAKGHQYGPDRLIGAANMFDVLPDGAVPDRVELSNELRAARDEARALFKKLERNPERDSILNALGRLGRASLKQKVRHRTRLLTEKIEDRLPELITVIDEAINCRNYYVHGSQSHINYDKAGIVTFLTNTLEFVFAASDLIEAGWDIEGWCKSSGGFSHPFRQYLQSYETEMSKLKSLLPSFDGSEF